VTVKAKKVRLFILWFFLCSFYVIAIENNSIEQVEESLTNKLQDKKIRKKKRRLSKKRKKRRKPKGRSKGARIRKNRRKWRNLRVKLGENIFSDLEEKRMIVLITSYNNAQWYKKNLDSVFNQTYKNYYVIYIDDCSPDGTGQLVENYIKERGLEDKVLLIRNEERVYKLANQYYAIHERCKDHDIVLELDGDDWFPNKHVLTYLNKVYSNPGVWLTYGTYTCYPSGEDGYSRVPWIIYVKRNQFREKGFFYTGLRTYYAGLFKLIKKEDLIYNGEDEEFQGKFYPISSDFAIIYPMLELSRYNHFRFIRDSLLIVNRDRGASFYSDRMYRVLCEINADVKSKSRYSSLEKPSWDMGLAIDS